jgi:hypothetical protein
MNCSKQGGSLYLNIRNEARDPLPATRAELEAFFTFVGAERRAIEQRRTAVGDTLALIDELVRFG